LVNPQTPGADAQLLEVHLAAQALSRPAVVLNASSEHELEDAFRAMSKMGAKALLVAADPFFNTRREQVIQLAAQHAVPAIYEFREFPVEGGLMSYGTSLADAYRQIGLYTGRILKGEKPSELPVMQPTKLELVINLNAAKTLGLQIPDKLLALADEVVE
jgi:putative ABC transport system substrate-binding protein